VPTGFLPVVRQAESDRVLRPRAHRRGNRRLSL
jgi:hypothetical protein